MKANRTQYIVEFKYRGKPGKPDTKWNRVTRNSRTNELMSSLDEAKYEVERLKREDASARRNGCSVESCGGIGISITHYREYDIIAYRIGKREVTPYETICEETVD